MAFRRAVVLYVFCSVEQRAVADKLANSRKQRQVSEGA